MIIGMLFLTKSCIFFIFLRILNQSPCDLAAYYDMKYGYDIILKQG